MINRQIYNKDSLFVFHFVSSSKYYLIMFQLFPGCMFIFCAAVHVRTSAVVCFYDQQQERRPLTNFVNKRLVKTRAMQR